MEFRRNPQLSGSVARFTHCCPHTDSLGQAHQATTDEAYAGGAEVVAVRRQFSGSCECRRIDRCRSPADPRHDERARRSRRNCRVVAARVVAARVAGTNRHRHAALDTFRVTQSAQGGPSTGAPASMASFWSWALSTARMGGEPVIIQRRSIVRARRLARGTSCSPWRQPVHYRLPAPRRGFLRPWWFPRWRCRWTRSIDAAPSTVVRWQRHPACGINCRAKFQRPRRPRDKASSQSRTRFPRWNRGTREGPTVPSKLASVACSWFDRSGLCLRGWLQALVSGPGCLALLDE